MPETPAEQGGQGFVTPHESQRVENPEEAEYIARQSHEIHSEISDIRSGKKKVSHDPMYTTDAIADRIMEATSIENEATFEYEFQHLPVEEQQARIASLKESMDRRTKSGTTYPYYVQQRYDKMVKIAGEQKPEPESL